MYEKERAWGQKTTSQSFTFTGTFALLLLFFSPTSPVKKAQNECLAVWSALSIVPEVPSGTAILTAESA